MGLQINLPQLHGHRATNKQQLWIVGCSFAQGNELQNVDLRYGQQIANYFDIPVSFLAQGGSSIEWAVDQIFRNDIRPNDIVVWGVTSLNRVLHYDKDGSIMHIIPSKFDKNHALSTTIASQLNDQQVWIKLLHDKVRLNHSVRHIAQVISYCAKVGCHLILCCHTELSLPEQSEKVLEYLKFTGLYVDLYHNLDQKTYIDYATDNKHPGMQTHTLWAETLIEFIKNKGYINET